MGELEMAKGSLSKNGEFALVQQECFIMGGTVLDNIVFGKEVNEERLKEVIHACCLESDLEDFPQGLDTEIGERGLNLSGGQKA